jgi:tetratricopeptide (TPR) repeat protein
VQSNPYNPRQREFDRANSLRRQSLIKASTRKLDKGENVPKLLSNLNETAEEFLRLGQYDAFATTLDVARKIALEVAGDFEKAHGYSERALRKENKITHKWVLLEHITSEAGYFYSKKDFVRARECICHAMDLYSKHPVVLEPVLATDGPRRHDIHEDLRRIGIGYETLLVEGITIAPSIPEVPLALRRSDVRRIVRSVTST